jgi:hypothetical protein
MCVGREHVEFVQRDWDAVAQFDVSLFDRELTGIS